MSVDATKLVIPGHGTIFTAPANTKPPTSALTAFSLTADTVANNETTPVNWANLGHTSKQNTIAFTKDGGDRETLDTFLADSVRVTTASTQWGFTANALQFDADTLDLAFNGDFDEGTGGYTVATPAPVSMAVFLFFQDVTAKLGFWIPNVEITLGDAPSVDAANFFELPLSGAIQTVANTVIPAVDGRAGLFQIFKDGLTAS